MLISAGDLIKLSWRDYKERWHEWTIFSFLIFLPTFILMVAGSFGVYLRFAIPGSTGIINLIILLMFLVAIIIGFWTSLVLIHAAGSYLQTQRIDYWKDHFVAVLPMLWPAIYTSIFVFVLTFLGVIFFLIPGIIFLVWFYFSLYEVVFKGKKGSAAMKESRNSVRGLWWGTLWRIFAPNFVFGASVILIQYILLTVISLFLTESIDLIDKIINAVLSALVAPLATLAMTRLYFSLKDNPVPAEAPSSPPASN